MEAVSAFFMRNIVYVYFFYGLAFFALGLVVLLESGRTSEFRFARALVPLALFGLVHGAHEWFEMFQIFAAHETGYVAGSPEDLFRIITLVLSFLLLLDFGARLLPGAEDHPRAHFWQVAAMGALWLAAVGFVAWRNQPSLPELLSAADVLARYSLAIPGALLAAWALLRERRDFHRARDVGLWAGSAVGRVGFHHLRPGADLHAAQPRLPLADDQHGVFPAHFRYPRAASARAGSSRHRHHPGRALRAFEQEGRIRLARANKARIEAQAATLEAQQRRASEVEALNIQLAAGARELSALVEMSRILTSTMDRRRLLDDALVSDRPQL